MHGGSNGFGLTAYRLSERGYERIDVGQSDQRFETQSPNQFC